MIINLGGAESFTYNKNTTFEFYDIILQNIFATIEISNFSKITVCGGEGIVKFLNEKSSNKDITIKTFPHHEYIKILLRAKYLIISQGLGNIYESISRNLPVFLLPAINNSQYWQSEAFRNRDKVFAFNWKDIATYQNIIKHEPQEIMLKKIRGNVENFINDNNAHVLFKNALNNYFDGYDKTLALYQSILKKHLNI